MAAPLRVLSREDWLRGLQEKRPEALGYHAFYSSFVGAVTKDCALMTIPLDDHMAHRGHAVFDTATLTNGRVYRLEKHLDRLLKSAERARIPLPMPREGLRDVVLQTCALSGRRDASVRYWLSAGPGDINIVPAKDAESCFYVLVWGGISMHTEQQDNGIAEVTITDVPLKPAFLATMKSNNYLLNALTAMTARDRGGHFGILVDKGYVAESCVLNVAFVDRQRRFRTPPFDAILAGTTVQRAMELVRDMPDVAGVDQSPVKVEELYDAVELMLLAGDCHVYPVLKLDSRPIGAGLPGPICRAIQAAIEREMTQGGTENFTAVPYPLGAP